MANLTGDENAANTSNVDDEYDVEEGWQRLKSWMDLTFSPELEANEAEIGDHFEEE